MTGIVAHTYPEWWLKLAGQVAHWSTDYSWLKNDRHFTFEDMISICYRFSRELEHSDPNLNEMERLMDEEDVFDFRNLLTI